MVRPLGYPWSDLLLVLREARRRKTSVNRRKREKKGSPHMAGIRQGLNTVGAVIEIVLALCVSAFKRAERERGWRENVHFKSNPKVKNIGKQRHSKMFF